MMCFVKRCCYKKSPGRFVCRGRSLTRGVLPRKLYWMIKLCLVRLWVRV